MSLINVKSFFGCNPMTQHHMIEKNIQPFYTQGNKGLLHSNSYLSTYPPTPTYLLIYQLLPTHPLLHTYLSTNSYLPTHSYIPTYLPTLTYPPTPTYLPIYQTCDCFHACRCNNNSHSMNFCF
jgi:hypothetical protein